MVRLTNKFIGTVVFLVGMVFLGSLEINQIVQQKEINNLATRPIPVVTRVVTETQTPTASPTAMFRKVLVVPSRIVTPVK